MRSEVDDRDDGDDAFDALLREAAHVPELALPVPRTGSLLRGRFELGRRLGEGGMGIVHEALDRDTGQVVALKTLSRLDPAYVHRLKREFRALSDVVHPNLVGLRELFSDGNLWFFTMDLVDGQDFLHFADDPSTVDTHGLSVAEAATRARGLVRPAPGARPVWHEPGFRSALRQLVRGVAALHAVGKLHRDLKPSNVLVTQRGRVVILDFGLAVDRPGHASAAEAIEDGHAAGGVLGTPAYMAPEQAAGGAATAASDWYAVGVMLYQALSGRLPFEGTVGDVLRAKQHSDPPSPALLAPDAPGDLVALCMALLSRDPAARPSSADMLSTFGEVSVQPGQSNPDAAPRARGHGEAFIARDAELDRLWAAFRQVGRGAPRVVFVHGSSGMGKTALVRHFLGLVERQGRALVLSARCYEREAMPFKAFDGIVDALVDHLRGPARAQAAELLPDGSEALARIFPSLTRVSPAVARARRTAGTPSDERRRAFAALKSLLGRMCDRTPLVLFIDDLQWSDLDSADLLEALLSPPDAPGLLVVGAYRREDAAASTFLRQVLRMPQVPVSTEEFYQRRVAAMLNAARRDVSAADGSGVDALLQGPAHLDPEQARLVLRARVVVEEVAVDRLSAQDAERLASALLHGRGDVPAMAAWVAQQSEGVPFFVHELSQYLVDAQRALAPEQHLQPSDFASLKEVLSRRMQALPPPALALVETVALAGRPIPRELALSAAQRSLGEARSLDLLASLHLIRSRGPGLGDEVEIYHDRVAEMVRGGMRPERIRAVHAQLAETLERSGRAQADWLAEHFQGAGMGERAGTYAAEAANQARGALASFGADALYRWAVALFSSEDAVLVRRGAARGFVLGSLLGTALATVAVYYLQLDATRGHRIATFVVALLVGGPIGMMLGSVYTLLTTTDPARRVRAPELEPQQERDGS